MNSMFGRLTYFPQKRLKPITGALLPRCEPKPKLLTYSISPVI